MNVIVSKVMISTVDSNFTSTCMGKESETLIFDVCHEDLTCDKMRQSAFLFAMDQSLVSAVNCMVQIHEAGASHPFYSFFMFIRKFNMK